MFLCGCVFCIEMLLIMFVIYYGRKYMLRFLFGLNVDRELRNGKNDNFVFYIMNKVLI